MCHFTNAPAPLPKQCEYGDASKVRQKTINLSFHPKYRAKLFLVDCFLSGDLLCSKFCQHNADWKCVDPCTEH